MTSSGMFVSLAHTEEVIDEYEEAMDPVFGDISDTLRVGDVTERIQGLVARPGFARLTDPTGIRPRVETAAQT